MIGDKECLNCGQNLVDLPGKRKKVFCNSTCRSNYWQKSDRLEKEGKSTEEIVSILSKLAKNNKPENKKRILEERSKVVIINFTQPTNEVKSLEQPKTNYTINTLQKQLEEKETEFSNVPDVGLGKKLRSKLKSDIDKIKQEISQLK